MHVADGWCLSGCAAHCVLLCRLEVDMHLGAAAAGSEVFCSGGCALHDGGYVSGCL